MKKKEVVIHIGMHKTGTTFLQSKVFPNFEGWSFLTRPYTQHNHAFNKLQFADDSLYQPKEILEEVDRIPGDRILISDESFTGKPFNWHFVNRTMIAKRFKEAFPEAKIILFLRGQFDSLISNYKNYIQGFYRGTLNAKDFIWRAEKDYLFEEFNGDTFAHHPMETLYYNNNYEGMQLDGFLYFELIRTYAELFENFHVFLYEDLKMNQEGVVKQLENILGTRLKDPEQIDYKTPVRKSLGPRDLAARRIENQFLKRFPKSPFGKLAGQISKPFLSPSWMKKQETYVRSLIEGFYDANNARICKEFPELGLHRFPDQYPGSRKFNGNPERKPMAKSHF